ncbi:MAG: hypothetical protein JWP89_2720 [Schlesneria sp.]|nr:hypothetical protein [Schlesneria sp.]
MAAIFGSLGQGGFSQRIGEEGPAPKFAIRTSSNMYVQIEATHFRPWGENNPRLEQSHVVLVEQSQATTFSFIPVVTTEFINPFALRIPLPKYEIAICDSAGSYLTAYPNNSVDLDGKRSSFGQAQLFTMHQLNSATALTLTGQTANALSLREIFTPTNNLGLNLWSSLTNRQISLGPVADLYLVSR